MQNLKYSLPHTKCNSKLYILKNFYSQQHSIMSLLQIFRLCDSTSQQLTTIVMPFSRPAPSIPTKVSPWYLNIFYMLKFDLDKWVPVTKACGVLSICEWMNSLRYEGQLRIYRISSREQPTGSGLPDWRLCEVLTTPHLKNELCCETVKD